jgi:hypothetical protein
MITVLICNGNHARDFFSPGGPVTILALVLTLIKDLLERKEEDETVF